MKNIMNFRLVFCCVISIIVAVLCATFIFVTKNSKLVMFIILLLMFILLLILYFKFKLKILAHFSVLILIFSLPFINLYARTFNIEKVNEFENKDVVVYGRISENYSKTSSGSVKIILDNITITSEDESTDVGGKIIIYIASKNLDKSKLKLGRFIYVSTILKTYDLKDDVYRSASNLSNGYVAYGSTYFYKITYTDKYDVKIRDSIKSHAKEHADSLNSEYSDIGYAMLFGDTSKLDSKTKTIFQTTGIAHLLAVSGFHVSIVLLMINFILRKLKTPEKLNIFIIICLLLFYAYLCEFSISVIRASFMALLALYAAHKRKPYDNLSVLSLVALILISINPFEMFNISFVLSFVSVLSIILLTPNFERLFKKCFEDKFASTLAIIFSVQVGVTATSIYYFGYFNPLSIIANLVSIPLVMVSFILFILIMFLVAIFPFLTFLIKIFDFGMSVVVKFNYFIVSLDLVLNFAKISALVIPIMILIMFICSDFTFFEKRAKVLSSMILIANIGLLLLLWVRKLYELDKKCLICYNLFWIKSVIKYNFYN